MNQNDDVWATIRTRMLAEIDRRKSGRWRMSLPDLMQWFGYTASRRVHQASLQGVLDLLAEWGIGFRLPGGTSAYDEIILFRIEPAQVQTPGVAPAQPVGPAPTTTALEYPTLTCIEPLPYLFSIDGVLEEERARLHALSLQSAIWSFRPVCLFVEANDDLFGFLCGYISALLYRRALMVRGGASETTPEIITIETLRRALGYTPNYVGWLFPVSGHVYIIRQNPDELEDDELVQGLRESLLPHTFTLIARHTLIGGTNGDSTDAASFDRLIQWFVAFAGTLRAVTPDIQQSVSMAGLLAEAVRNRDMLLDRRMLQPSDTALRSGFESSEHVVLKTILLSGLRRRFPTEKIAVEEGIIAQTDDDDNFEERFPTDRPRRDRPDIRVGDQIWVEIETLRGLSLYGSNPFFELEAKLRPRLKNMAAVRTIWLMVPSDLALLASDQIRAITRNLNHALGADKIRCGFVDVLTEEPVLLPSSEPPASEPLRLRGILLRRERPKTQNLTWGDIAGYADIKQRLHDDILDPLVNRQRYAPFGIVAANGVLLYGLPGCGKSLIGQVIAGEADLNCRLLKPSDLTSMWLGEGVMKIRAVFDWAIRQAPCVLILDELDAVAPQRQEHNMHTDEKRQVNELLAQLSRIADQGVIVVGTTNYARGIDAAIQRSGRFDVKLPIFPPDEQDRAAIFHYYLSEPRLKGFAETEAIDGALLAAAAPLYTPADIKAVVHATARKAIRRSEGQPPVLTTDDLLLTLGSWPRSIRYDLARTWIAEAELELGAEPQLRWLREEIERAYGEKV